MSVRVHALAKEIKKTSKEVLDLLAERGYDLKSASSTIDNITAQSLKEEFSSENAASMNENSDSSADVKSSMSSEVKTSSGSPKIPLVKSKADLEIERVAREKADKSQNGIAL